VYFFFNSIMLACFPIIFKSYVKPPQAYIMVYPVYVGINTFIALKSLTLKLMCVCVCKGKHND